MWQVPREGRQRAFAILPCGNEMLARIDRCLSAHRMPLDPEQAVGLLRSGLQLAQNAVVTTLPTPETQIEILSEAEVPLLDMRAESPFVEITDGLSDAAMKHQGEIDLDAYFFLSEPLYRLRSSYHPAYWVRSPLCSDPGAADLTETSYLLEQFGWSAGWTGERLFVFDRREEFGLS
jgi:hypothetical protein